MTLSEEDRIKAQLQVEAFVDIFCVRYGIKDEEIPELIGNLRWLGRHKTNIEGITMKAAMTFIALAITGVALAFWEGLKHFLAK